MDKQIVLDAIEYAYWEGWSHRGLLSNTNLPHPLWDRSKTKNYLDSITDPNAPIKDMIGSLLAEIKHRLLWRLKGNNNG